MKTADADRLDIILCEQIDDIQRRHGELVALAEKLGELYRASASLPNRQDGYAEWAKSHAKRLDKAAAVLSREFDETWGRERDRRDRRW